MKNPINQLNMNPFPILEGELQRIEKELLFLDCMCLDMLYDDKFINVLNQSSFLITVHDVEAFKPLYINDKMRSFYGFKENKLKGMDYLYYLTTIHTSTYHTLVESISFFRKNKDGFLNLKYKLKNYQSVWKDTVGSTKTMIWDKRGQAKIGITVMEERLVEMDTSIFSELLKLTVREREIAQLLVSGLSKKEVATKLFISVATVETHTKNVYKKLKVNKIVELAQLLEQFQSTMDE
ncbi:regulatory protein, luxR family [Sphingobacterium nematocida]|uniref:Regulatory protein, luxR family n=1 Tax=Sphingobacterium nematocida TaxID=1513896 RepID=A0A1T5F070_9SPHI|nr:helix-turn-helix transcriptional regulator [Sphingobacterium nematocida]SKB89380.1 regulatory protein, luxR family [Sphingobacterium nematocida]